MLPTETKVFIGPCNAIVRVRLSDRDLDLRDRWLVPSNQLNVVLVESSLESLFVDNLESLVHFSVLHGKVVVTTTSFPWRTEIRASDMSPVMLEARKVGAQVARRCARESYSKEGWVTDASGEKALSIRLTEKCPETHEKYCKKLACGHVKCELCDGYVCPQSRIVLKGPGPIVKCNRLPRGFKDYEHLFRETFAGSCRLTEAMDKHLRRALPNDVRQLVGDPRDVLWSKDNDITDKRVYER